MTDNGGLRQQGICNLVRDSTGVYDAVMHHILLAFLLTANLLACPMRCLSGQMAVDAGDQQASTSCCCCHCDSEMPSPQEESPRDDCACPDCICDGATLQDAFEVRLADVAWDTLDWAPSAVHALHAVPLALRSHFEGPPGDRSGGRGALVAYQIWLI